MIRRMRQGAAALALVCMLTMLLPIYLMTAFAANTRIAFSDPSATVGGEINVKMKVTSSSNLSNVDIMLAYDASVLEFVEGTNADGGNGAIRVHGDAGTPNTGTLAFDLKFNALAAGSTKITVTSQEVYDADSKLVTVDKQGDSTVTVNALATASKDASLKSLQVSPGTLTPEFSPDVDTYAVTVGTDVDKLVISAECTDENANKVISGNENLQMGENRVSLKVIAQDGETSKEYTIVVTKAEGGASDNTAAQFSMHVSERSITVLEPDDSVQIPDGFKESTIKIDGHEVTGWVWGSESEHQYCVIYGMNEAGEKNFYRYDLKDTERTIQRYFEDPAISGSVSEEVYTQLAGNYDALRKDFNLFRGLLIAVIVIALILLVVLIANLTGKKGNTPSNRGKNERKSKTADRLSERKPVSEMEDSEVDYVPEENDRLEPDEEDAYEETSSYAEREEAEEFSYEDSGQYEDEEDFDLEDFDEEDIEAEEDDDAEEYAEPEQDFYEEEDAYDDENDAVSEEPEYEEPSYEEPEYEEPVYEKPVRKPAPAPKKEAPVRKPASRPVTPKEAPKPSRDDDDFEIFDL